MKCSSNQKWSNDKSQCECENPKKKNIMSARKVIFGSLVLCTCENGKYVGSITVDSAITCNEVIEVTKTVPTKTFSWKTVSTNFHREKVTYKIENFYILVAFLLIFIALLITVSIYYCFKKHRPNQKHLLPYHDIISKLKK